MPTYVAIRMCASCEGRWMWGESVWRAKKLTVIASVTPEKSPPQKDHVVRHVPRHVENHVRVHRDFCASASAPPCLVPGLARHPMLAHASSPSSPLPRPSRAPRALHRTRVRCRTRLSCSTHCMCMCMCMCMCEACSNAMRLAAASMHVAHAPDCSYRARAANQCMHVTHVVAPSSAPQTRDDK